MYSIARSLKFFWFVENKIVSISSYYTWLVDDKIFYSGYIIHIQELIYIFTIVVIVQNDLGSLEDRSFFVSFL